MYRRILGASVRQAPKPPAPTSNEFELPFNGFCGSVRFANFANMDGANIHSVAVNTTPHQTARNVIVLKNERGFARELSQFPRSRSRIHTLVINSSTTK